MKHVMLTIITFLSFLVTQNIQAQNNGNVIKKSQITKIEGLKTKEYKLKNGKTYKAYKVNSLKQYLNNPNLHVFTPVEMEKLEPGEACENTEKTCSEGYECKNARFLVEDDCSWFTKTFFGCDTYFIVRTYKECIPINSINNEN